MQLSSFEPEVLRDSLLASSDSFLPREDCPSAEDLWRAVSGDLDTKKTRLIVEHLAECPVCAEEWDVTRDLVQGSPSVLMEQAPSHQEVKEEAKIEGRSRWELWFGLAAVLLLVATMPLVFGPFESVRRGAEQEAEIRLTSDEAALREGWVGWSGPVEYESYLLEIMLVDQDVFESLIQQIEVQTKNGDVTYPLEPHSVEKIRDGASLLLKVTPIRDGELLEPEFLNLEVGNPPSQ